MANINMWILHCYFCVFVWKSAFFCFMEHQTKCNCKLVSKWKFAIPQEMFHGDFQDKHNSKKNGRHNQPWRLPASARSYVDIPNTLGWAFESMVKNEILFIKNCSGNTLDSKQNCKGFEFSFLVKKNTPMLLEKMNKQIKNNGIPGYPSSPQQSKTPSTPREIAGYFRPF